MKSKGPLSKIHSPHLYVGAPGIFSGLLRSVQMLERERERERERVALRKATGSYRTYSSLVKLQPWFLSLRWKTYIRQNCNVGSFPCSEGPALGQSTHDDESCFSILNYSVSQIDVYTLWNVISQQQNDTEIQFCCVWSRRHWKSLATHSSFFMCSNKYDCEIIIRWTQVVTEVLLESGECWSSTKL